MSRLEELIQQLCPDGVKWTRLIDIAYVQYGYPFDSNLFSDDNKYIPLIRIRDVKPAVASTYYSGTYDTMFIIKKGDILVGMDGNFNLERWNDRDGLLNQRVCKICTRNESTVTNGYLYHLLKPLFKKIEDDIEGSTVKHLSAKVINQIYIPLPPLPVQEEIVRLLDQLTETTQKYQAELEAELDVRKKQYEEYRKKILTFEESRIDVKWYHLGDIGNACMCRRIMKNQTTTEGEIPFYKIGTFGKVADAYISRELYELYKKNYSFPRKGDILLSASGTIGRTVVYNGEDAYYQDSNIVWVDNNEQIILNSYLFYVYKIIDWKTANGGVIERLYNNILLSAQIQIPPLDEQERIVNILDRMDKTHKELCQSIETEIKMRKQQYEFYRNRLLDFKKKEE